MLDDIYYGFRNIIGAAEPIRLTNTFHGMPVSNTGTVLNMEGGEVTIQTTRTQIICMRMTRKTFVTSNLLPFTLKAKVLTWSLYDQTVLLDTFRRSSNTIGGRNLVRVDTSQRIPAILSLETEDMPHMQYVQLIEMSLRGISVLVDKNSFDEKHFGKGTSIFIEFMLELRDQEEVQRVPIQYRGVVNNIVLTDFLVYRLGIQVYPTKETERLITRYIGQRQIELLRQLRKMSEDFLIF